jgi:DNA-binding beta-propeller fold protein YncE
MNSCRALQRLVQAGAALTAVALMAGCGDSYRPVVTSTSASGPAAQVASYAIVVSAPSLTSGIATIIDYSGDSIMAYASIGTNTSPLNFALDEIAGYGYTINRDGTMTNFPMSTTLQDKNILYSTLSSGSSVTNLLAPASGLWAAEATNNLVDYFSGSPEALKLTIPMTTSNATTAIQPVALAGPGTSSGQYQYAISQNLSSSTICNSGPHAQSTTGSVTPITISTDTAGTPIAVGVCPVYGVQSTDLKRLFVLNRGSDTISVINTETNAADKCTPYQNTSGAWVTCHPTISLPSGSGPVEAEYNVTTQQLVVANYDGGTISVIDVPLDTYGNDSNTYSGTCLDSSGSSSYSNCGSVASGFGVVHTISVGNTTTPYPASVTLLYDGTKAYSANQGDGTDNGTVTVVNLSSYTVEKTLTVTGHPRTVVSTQNSDYSKIYVGATDSPYLTIIESTGTSTDVIDTTLQVEGNVVDVRTTTQNGSSGNNNYVSRTPGYGQPCSLPPNSTYWSSSTLTLDNCRQIPSSSY